MVELIEQVPQKDGYRPFHFYDHTFYAPKDATHVWCDSDGEVSVGLREPERHEQEDCSGFFRDEESPTLYVGTITPLPDYGWIVSCEEIKWGSAYGEKI